jgi:hypothetical protein
MTNENSKQPRTKLTAYWVTTGLLTFGMLSGGIAQLAGAKWNADGMAHLGYPHYLMAIIGVWKILGVTALLWPGYRLLKEWAYAGFFFVMTGAVISHLASGDGIKGIIAQSIFVILIILSWYLRSDSRKLKTK